MSFIVYFCGCDDGHVDCGDVCCMRVTADGCVVVTYGCLDGFVVVVADIVLARATSVIIIVVVITFCRCDRCCG